MKANALLIAEPFLWDDTFKRAVILIADHHSEGTHGFILNRPLGVKLNDVLGNTFPEIDATVYLGGPVETDTLHYLHNVGDLIANAHKIADGIWWGGDFEELKFLIAQKMITPNNVRFYIGYTGWEKGQLADEIADKTWILADGHTNFVFNNYPSLWQKTLSTIDETHSIIGTMPDYPFWN